jgi:amidase
MLDCVSAPQVGDPFPIPTPVEPYAALARERPPRLRIGWSCTPSMNVAVDVEVRRAVEQTAALLVEMGHEVTEAGPEYDGLRAIRDMTDVWFFGFDVRLEVFSKRSGRAIGQDTLEAVTFKIYEHARRMKAEQIVNALAGLNSARRQLARFFVHHDVWLCPTSARVAEPWGTYNLDRRDVEIPDLTEKVFNPLCQFTLPHNILGAPAISLPLAMHSTGLPIGVQLGVRPAQEHVALQLASALEEARPWAGRVPEHHAGRVPSNPPATTA